MSETPAEDVFVEPIAEVNGVSIYPGPVWENCCEHPSETYMGTIEEWHFKPIKAEFVDVYLHAGSLCIRRSDEPSDYMGVPDQTFLLLVGGSCTDLLRKVFDLLTGLGEFRWHRKEETSGS